MLVSTYYVKDSRARAEVCVEMEDDINEYSVNYFNTEGGLIKSRSFKGKSVHFAESAAENWVLTQEIILG